MRKRAMVVSLTLVIAFLFQVSTMPQRTVAPPVNYMPIVTVDISGSRFNETGGSFNATHTLAVGYGTNITVFSLSAANGVTYFTELYTSDVGFDVDYVVVSEGSRYGAYVVVAGNDRPFNNTSKGYVRLYAPYASAVGPEPLLYEIELEHSVYSAESKPIDIARSSRFVAFGTGIVNISTQNNTGMVYVVETPMRHTSSPNMWTYDYQDWVQSVRFAGDNTSLVVGTFWNHSFAKFNISNLPDLSPDWKTGNLNDPYYAVAPSFNASGIATGHGHLHKILFEDGSDGSDIWSSSQYGTQRRIVLDDGNEYFISTQYMCHDSDSYAFHYFSTASPSPGTPKTPIWTYNPTVSSTRPVTADLSVNNSSLFVVGGSGARVYRWGDGNPVTSGTPRFTFIANDTVNEVAMSYDGEYSIAGDELGYFYVFDKDEGMPIATWQQS